MNIRSIDLEDGVPSALTVTMSADEALFIAAVLGKMNGQQASGILESGDFVQDGIYSALTGLVFNRFYEDGVVEALSLRGGAA